MSIIHSLILGVIQGLGEFLPISSSGHLLLSRIFFGIQTDTPAMKMLDILLHIGTLLPVLIVFRKEWIDMILHPVRNKTFILLVAASIPTLAIYLLAKKLFPQVNGFAVFDNGWFLGVSFLITAFFLLLCDLLASRKGKSGRKVGFLQAVVMGFFQVRTVGLIPLTTMGARKTVPSRMARMVALGLLYISFNPYSSILAALGVMVAHLTATPYFKVALALSTLI